MTLSTITVAPTLCARSLTIFMSTISNNGLLGVSMKTALVGLLSALAQSAGSFPFTNSYVTPHFGKNSVMTTWQEENIAADATTWSPCSTKQARDANIADIPEPVATHISAPSIAASRFSNIAIVGL